MKKALIVANLAGFASFLLSDIDILCEMGYQVTFAANIGVLPWDDTRVQLVNRGVRILQIDFDSKKPFSYKNVRAFRQLCEIVNADRYDLIHCHTPIAGLLTRVAAQHCRRQGTKVIYTSHGLSFTKNSSLKTKLLFKTIEGLGSLWCDAIIAINKEDYEVIRRMYCANVYYIHGVGVDIDRYKDVCIDRMAYRNSIGVTDDEIMVLSVGELSERKNHQIILEAFKYLPRNQKFVYVICGNGIDGGTAQMLQAKAEGNGARLLLLGFRNDIPQIMHCSDIGAIPSIREGLGLAGIQSLAAGVPLVGTDVQGIRDYIVPGETGYLCAANDAEGYAKAIEKLLSLTASEKNRWCERCEEMAYTFDMSISARERKLIYHEQLCEDSLQ